MKSKITFLVIGALLFLAGGAGASNLNQVLLDGTLIPKFVDPLPVAGDITVVDATSTGTPDYNIHIMEFQSQVLPSTGVPDPDNPGSYLVPPDTPSWVWGYLTDSDKTAWDSTGTPRPSFLGPVVVAQRGTPAHPTYLNELPPVATGHVQQNLPVDMTLDWANPINTDCQPDPTSDPPGAYQNILCGDLPYLGPWPAAVHIHGGEVAPAYDGGPDAWTSPIGSGGPDGIGYPGNTYTYPNGQQEGTIWFHPHEFGITRLGVYAGLAGVYPIVDPGGPSAPVATLPHFPEFDIPLIIQDRSFDTNGEVFYNLASNPQPNPDVHPFWIPEFLGDAICVNGKTWPYLEVEPRQYRFRLLNGSNARFYDLTITHNGDTPFLPFLAIATDDGYIENAVQTNHVVIAPGERYEVVVDFGGLPPGFKLVLRNAANTPYPGGEPIIEGTTDTVMQFTLVSNTSGLADTHIANGTPIRPTALPTIADAHDPATGSITRQLTLNEVLSVDGPLELVVNNSKYNLVNTPAILPGSPNPLNRETELPAVGDTEIWEIINITADAHPMHTHLISFQLLDRTPFSSENWITQYEALLLANGVEPGGGPPNQYNKKNADGAIGGNPAVSSFLDLAHRRGPEPYEMGWKDTVICYPGEVTRIVARWAPQDDPVTGAGAPSAGVNHYPFDPTALEGGVGYVWHCHILDHEDNEMMRNYTVLNARQPVVTGGASPDINGDGCVSRTDYNLLVVAIRSRSRDTAKYDINGDGVVNILDARALISQFDNPGGAPCPT
jgi:spore coat protein A